MNGNQPKEIKNNRQTSQDMQSKQCENCGTLFVPKKRTNKDKITKTCSSKCRYELRAKANLKSYICKNEHCNKEFSSAATNTEGFCSVMCRTIVHSYAEYVGTEGIDYIVCPLCHLRTKQFNPGHAQMHGFNTPKEMQIALNIPLITCIKKKENAKGENNPAYQHGGKYSHFSKNFINGYDEEKHQKVINDNRHRNIEQPELFKTNIAYWLKQTNGDKELAHELYMKFQIRDINWFIERYGEEEGKIHHKNKIAKWMKSYKKCNFSKISQDLFNEIMKLSDLDINQIYYATFEREDMKEYYNKEYILKFEDGSCIRPDFIILDKRLIIEFDGEYWHSNANSKFSTSGVLRDRIRDEKIVKNGYKVLHIDEKEYRLNKQKVIEECINFLKQ